MHPVMAALIDLSGVGTVLLIMAVAGAIAFIGDRVGHQVGRRRMTLFGLRPRYTSTIFAIVFGMVIALVAVIVLSLFSENARQAIFSMKKINEQIDTLQKERDQLLQDPVVFRAGEALSQPVIVDTKLPQSDIENDLVRLFAFVADQTSKIPYVTPYPKELTPQVRAKLSETAAHIKSLAPVPAIVVPVAAENIFRNGAMRISLDVYKDSLLYRKGEIIASVAVADGKDRNKDRDALITLLYAIKVQATEHGMPPTLADNPSTAVAALDDFINRLTTTSGPVVVNAIAAADIRAEGPLTTTLVVSPARVTPTP